MPRIVHHHRQTGAGTALAAAHGFRCEVAAAGGQFGGSGRIADGLSLCKLVRKLWPGEHPISVGGDESTGPATECRLFCKGPGVEHARYGQTPRAG